MEPLLEEKQKLLFSKCEKLTLYAYNFLTTLYNSCEQGFIAIRSGNENQTQFFRVNNIRDTVYHVVTKGVGNDVFFGVCLRKEDREYRKLNQQENLCISPGIWLEITSQDRLHSEEVVLEFLYSFPLEPSIIVNTGSSYQVYFLFDSPYLLEGNESRTELQNLLRDFQSLYEKQAESCGLHVETSGDLTGYQRVPGTWNHESESIMPLVITEVATDFRYSLENIRAAVDSSRSRVALEDDQDDLVLAQCDDAPVKPEAVIPFGWTIGKDELRQNAGNDLVTRQPIFISSKYENLQDGSLSLELVYRYGGKWKRTCLPRSHAFQESALKQCANFGMKITPKNAPRIAEYLGAYEEANLQAGIREYYSSSKFGWQKIGGKDVFLLGHMRYSLLFGPRGGENKVIGPAVLRY
jgi:hypothetical protein